MMVKWLLAIALIIVGAADASARSFKEQFPDAKIADQE